MSNTKEEKKKMKTLDPCWDRGEYIVKEINKETNTLTESLGISEKRQLELRMIVIREILEHNCILIPIMKVSEECIHPNELAFACWFVGRESVMLQHAEGYRENMEKQLKLLEEKLNGSQDQCISCVDDDEELVFPEEKKEEEEELTFDD